MKEKKRPVIIDCDTGTDDAIAIIAALGSEEFDIKAITTVCGNVDLEYTSVNTLNLIDALGFHIPVATGASHPIVRDLKEFRKSESSAPGLCSHGQKGMGNVVLPISSRKFFSKDAIQLIYDIAIECEGQLEIIALAPQTNLALALQKYPELKEGLIKHIYFMGGAVTGGNSTAVAEFNVFFDPEAARIVLQSGIPCTMIGLDVTAKAIIPDDICEKIRRLPGVAAKITSDILDFMRLRRDKFGGEDTVMHDAVAVAVACVPAIVQTKKYFVDVECVGKYTYGHTYVQRTLRLSNNRANCEVALTLDLNYFISWLIESIRSCDAR